MARRTADAPPGTSLQDWIRSRGPRHLHGRGTSHGERDPESSHLCSQGAEEPACSSWIASGSSGGGISPEPYIHRHFCTAVFPRAFGGAMAWCRPAGRHGDRTGCRPEPAGCLSGTCAGNGCGESRSAPNHVGRQGARKDSPIRNSGQRDLSSPPGSTPSRDVHRLEGPADGPLPRPPLREFDASGAQLATEHPAQFRVSFDPVDATDQGPPMESRPLERIGRIRSEEVGSASSRPADRCSASSPRGGLGGPGDGP